MAGRINNKSNQSMRMVRNQLSSLILFEEMKTTVARAKVLKDEMQRLIANIDRNEGYELKRELLKKLYGNSVNKAIDFKGKFESVSIYKVGPRSGDAAPMAIVKLNIKQDIEKPKQKADKTAKKS